MSEKITLPKSLPLISPVKRRPTVASGLCCAFTPSSASVAPNITAGGG
jgi:hypothetical protein